MHRNPRDDSTEDARPSGSSSDPLNFPLTDREERLAGVLLEFMEASEAGQQPEPTAWIAAHPDLAEELAEFFTNQAHIEGLTRPMRTAPRMMRPTPPNIPLEGIGRLGDFVLIREIGRGGMGVVYEAEQVSLNRRVALKVLPFAASFDPRSLQRFQNEARAAACLHHNHIVPVFAVGSERGVHYYAMQLIEGQSLSALIADLRRQHGLIDESSSEAVVGHDVPTRPIAAGPTEAAGKTRSFANIAKLIMQAANALEHAHETGIIHRDIKPGNLLLDPMGKLWVTDFGLAIFRVGNGLTQTGEVVGTIRYASPEQALGKPGLVDHRTDVYSLGVTLYEWLTLHPIFEGVDRQILINQIAQEDPKPPRHWDRSIPTALETIVLKAIAKQPHERYATAQEFADDLKRFLTDQPVQAKRPTLMDRGVKWSRRHRGIVVTVGLALFVGLIGLAISTAMIANAYERERQKSLEANDQRQRAEASLRDARKAVDLFTELTEEELPQRPEVNSMRRRVLESAIVFYQDFIDRHQDDVTIQQELADSRARLQRAIEQLTLIQGVIQLRFLNWPPVQEDLSLTSFQINEIRRLEMLYLPTPEMFRSTREMGEEQRNAFFTERAKAHEREVSAVLSMPQGQRFRQLTIQLRGPTVFLESPIPESLGITASQRQSIRRILEEMAFTAKGPGPGFGGPFPGGRPPMMGPPNGPPNGPRGGDRPEMDVTKSILALFTPEQLTAWQKLTGEPFRMGPSFGTPRR